MGTNSSSFHSQQMNETKNFPRHQEFRCSAADPAITWTQLLDEIGRSWERHLGHLLFKHLLSPARSHWEDSSFYKTFLRLNFLQHFGSPSETSFPLEHHQQQVNGKVKVIHLAKYKTYIMKGWNTDVAGRTRCTSITWVFWTLKI